jgi:hypothetical protein
MGCAKDPTRTTKIQKQFVAFVLDRQESVLLSKVVQSSKITS